MDFILDITISRVFYARQQCTFRRALFVLLLEVSVFAVVCSWCPCNWEPGRGVPGCRGGLRPASSLFVWVLLIETSSLIGPLLCFTFSPAKWASPQLNGPVQHRVYF